MLDAFDDSFRILHLDLHADTMVRGFARHLEAKIAKRNVSVLRMELGKAECLLRPAEQTGQQAMEEAVGHEAIRESVQRDRVLQTLRGTAEGDVKDWTLRDLL